MKTHPTTSAPGMDGKRTFTRAIHLATAIAAASLVTASSKADSIAIPNFSFESQSGVGQPGGVNISIDSWQKAPKPDYFDEGSFGFLWIQTAGNFVDSNPYVNRDGTQAAYMLSFPGVTLSQDLSATFQVGMHYDFTLGLNGKSMTNAAFLQLSLYYRDGGDNMVTIGSPTTIFFSDATFPNTAPLSLTDFTASIPEVSSGDAWAGKNIGIEIQSVYGNGNGYWDIDNARLVSVPEPAAFAMIGAGLAALAFVRRKAIKR